jgi:hypothetical protein
MTVSLKNNVPWPYSQSAEAYTAMAEGFQEARAPTNTRERSCLGGRIMTASEHSNQAQPHTASPIRQLDPIPNRSWRKRDTPGKVDRKPWALAPCRRGWRSRNKTSNYATGKTEHSRRPRLSVSRRKRSQRLISLLLHQWQAKATRVGARGSGRS